MPRHSYRVFETQQFTNDLRQLGVGVAIAIRQKLAAHLYPQLVKEPHYGPNIKRLKDWDPSTWRYRIGPWRFFYEIDDLAHVVYMTAAAHRKDAYR